jgi:hypothetical protein
MLTDVLGVGVYVAAVYYSTVNVFAPSLVSFACSMTGLNCFFAVIVMYSLKKSALAKFSKKQRISVQVLADTNEQGGIKSSGAPLNEANQQGTDLKTIILPKIKI